MRSLQQEREADELEDLEELGDDAIIAQATDAHALKPRANVSDEARSVVITDHHVRRDTQPPRNPAAPRSTGEATLVIRDRRALDELREDIVKRQAQKRRGHRALYAWGGLGLAAFVLGGVAAFVATDSRSAAPSVAASASAGSRVAVPAQAPIARPGPSAAEGPHAVRLDDLPMEPRHKH